LSGIFETVLYYRRGEVQDVERFYGDVLGLRAVSRSPDGFAFRLQTGLLLLFDADQTLARPDEAMRHGATGAVHVCFLAPAAEYERWKEHLRTHGIALLREATWPNGVRSVYVSDPAGNLVEISEGDLWPA
jgi:catechol 2,3-dioxygenase-like lactoylglutathione lyase family enzyme